VNPSRGSRPTSSANMVNRHRIRKSATACGACPDASSDRAIAASFAATSRVTLAARRPGSSSSGAVHASRSRSRTPASASSASLIRWVLASGNATYVRPDREKSANSSMVCPTSTTIRKGGQPSAVGRALAYCSACPRASTIAASQPVVPRTAVPRRPALGRASPPAPAAASLALRSLPCFASRTKQPRLYRSIRPDRVWPSGSWNVTARSKT